MKRGITEGMSCLAACGGTAVAGLMRTLRRAWAHRTIGEPTLRKKLAVRED